MQNEAVHSSASWVGGCSLALAMECALRVEEHITIRAARRHRPCIWSDAYCQDSVPRRVMCPGLERLALLLGIHLHPGTYRLK